MNITRIDIEELASSQTAPLKASVMVHTDEGTVNLIARTEAQACASTRLRGFLADSLRQLRRMPDIRSGRVSLSIAPEAHPLLSREAA